MKAIIILLIFCSGYASFSQDLTVKAILDNKEYLLGESIFVIIELTNNETSNIHLNAFDIMYGRSGLEVILMDDDNNVIKPLSGHQPLEYGPGKNKLKAGNTVATFLYLTDWYSNSKSKGISLWGHGSLKPGNYKLKINYEYRDPQSFQLINRYTSEWNYFTVVEPRSDELFIYNEIVRYDDKRFMDLSPMEDHQQLAAIQEILANYPKSKYIPSLARDMFYLIKDDDYIILDGLMHILFDNCPESNVNIIAIAHYATKRYERFKTAEFQSKINKRLMNIIGHFPDIKQKLIGLFKNILQMV